MNVSRELTRILRENPSLKIVPDETKIQCSLTGHEMPFRLDAVQSYISGKKYQRVRIAFTTDEEKLKKYKEFLVPSKKKYHEKQLFCELTWRHLNTHPHHIQRHVQGKRFQTAFARWEECQKSGEPFKPRGGRRKRRVPEEDDKDDMDDSDNESVESYSDLYPAADFADMTLEEEEDDDQGMNEQEGTSAGAGAKPQEVKHSKKQPQHKGEKRKQKVSNHTTRPASKTSSKKRQKAV